MRYGDGWAYDSTHSHYKRANRLIQTQKMTGAADPSLWLGSTSKTYDPRKDGDTSEASTEAHRLGSIHEAEDDEVKAPSEKADHWW